MVTSDDLFNLNGMGLKYKILRIEQRDDGLRFSIKMEHEMKPTKAEDKHEVVELRAITGGRDGGKDWLSSLPRKTVFLSKNKDNNPMLPKSGCVLTQFHVQQKYKKSALLLSNFPGQEFQIFVETKSFSAENELVEIMQEGEQSDGNSNSNETGLDKS